MHRFPSSQPISLSPSTLNKRRLSPASPALCDLRHLKTKVAHLLAHDYERCRSCVRKHAINPQQTDFSVFLEGRLERAEFESVVHNPSVFIKDPRLCKELTVEEEPSWDYLLAHEPEEITPLHLYYKKKSEEKRERIRLQREKLQRKKEKREDRQSFPGTSKSIIRVHPGTIFEQQEMSTQLPSSLSSDKFILPHIGSVPLLFDQKNKRATRCESTGKKAIWKKLNDTFVEAESKYRSKVAKDNYYKKFPSEQKRDSRVERSDKAVELSSYGELQRDFARRKSEKRLTHKEGSGLFSRLQKLL